MRGSAAPITSVRNSRIVEARKLTQRKHRSRTNRFLVEGLQLLGMAVECAETVRERIRPIELFFCPELFTGEMAPRLVDDLLALGANAIPVAPQVLDTLSERETSQGLACTFSIESLESDLEHLALRCPEEPILVLVLDRLQDPGNLGTLIRTADAVASSAVVLLEPCVDPFDPKTVRGTMGSLFSVPFARVGSTSELFAWLQTMGLSPVGADGSMGELTWNSGALRGSAALVLGNEARGLSQDVREHVETYVALPLLGGAESLNVAIAGGVLMYEWLRVNRPEAAGTDRPASQSGCPRAPGPSRPGM